MKQDNQKKLHRRHFLAAGSASAISSLLISSSLNKSEARTISSSPNITQELSNDALSVGYLPADAPSANTSGWDFESLTQWIRRRTREAVTNEIPEHSIRPDDQFPEGAFVKPADLITGDPTLLKQGVKVVMAGLYTNSRQWGSKDSGSFMMRVKFDEVGTGKKVSSATIGSTFLARPNNIAAQFSGGMSVDQLKIATTSGLKIGFDLIDIGDPKDKTVVEKSIQVANLIAPLTGSGVLTAIAKGFGEGIEPASQVLQAFGVDYLKQDQKNKVLWSSKFPTGADLDISFVTDNTPRQVKLRPGIYFIAGLTRNSQPPAWGGYFLRAADRRNEGPKDFLYYRDVSRSKVVPADFTYVTLVIGPASPAPPQQG